MNQQEKSNILINLSNINKKVWVSPSLELILKDEITNQAFPGKDGGGSTSSKS